MSKTSYFIIILTIFALASIFYLYPYQTPSAQIEPSITPNTTYRAAETRREYTGPVYHVFFHSLIIYPEKAFSDLRSADGYKENMLTVEQFKQVIQQLYEHNFILIDSRSLYLFDDDGVVHPGKLYLPEGKKPLIISIDDLNYYSYMKDKGFANRLVIEDGVVKTEVLTPNGQTIVTEDGDVVPIVDTFLKEHPDFSLDGAKGIIGLTGFEGILGYRTKLHGEIGEIEREQALKVVNRLRESGWIFANHSFGHGQGFLQGTITSEMLANDISRWNNEVRPLVGETNIFIGPFGQIFTASDPRRAQLIAAGFNVLYGVGMDGYIKFFDNYFVMNRIDLDIYRLQHNAKKLYDLFGIKVDTNFNSL